MDVVYDRSVEPIYRRLVGTGAAQSDEALEAELVRAGRLTTARHVLDQLRTPGPPAAVGAWFALFHDRQDIVEAVLEALAWSGGRVDAPSLVTAAAVLAGPSAVPAIDAYVARDVEHGWGAAGFAGAALRHVGAAAPIAPLDDDERTFSTLRGLASRLRGQRYPEADQSPRGSALASSFGRGVGWDALVAELDYCDDGYRAGVATIDGVPHVFLADDYSSPPNDITYLTWPVDLRWLSNDDDRAFLLAEWNRRYEACFDSDVEVSLTSTGRLFGVEQDAVDHRPPSHALRRCATWPPPPAPVDGELVWPAVRIRWGAPILAASGGADLAVERL